MSPEVQASGNLGLEQSRREVGFEPDSEVWPEVFLEVKGRNSSIESQQDTESWRSGRKGRGFKDTKGLRSADSRGPEGTVEWEGQERGAQGSWERQSFPRETALGWVSKTKAKRVDHGTEGRNLGTGKWLWRVRPHD